MGTRYNGDRHRLQRQFAINSPHPVRACPHFAFPILRAQFAAVTFFRFRSSTFTAAFHLLFEASRGSETKSRDRPGSARKVDSGNPDALTCTNVCALCSGGILGCIRDESGNPVSLVAGIAWFAGAHPHHAGIYEFIPKQSRQS